MKLSAKHVHTVRVRRPDGSATVYRYHRLSRERLSGEPGSAEFLKSWADADRAFRENIGGAGKHGTIAGAIARYKASEAFTGRKPRTRADYAKMLDLIADEFGRAKIGAFADRRIRGDVIRWRDKLALRSPKLSDMALTVLGLLIKSIINDGDLTIDHRADLPRLYKSDRADKIWTPADVAAFMDGARPELRLAMILALNTGQRQGDLLRLTWAAFDGEALTLRQSKTGARVAIPCTQELRQALEAEKKGAGKKRLTILADSRGEPWKGNGFRLAWGRRVEAAGLKDRGLTFHDLRGTAVTALADAGCTEAQIAAITGHTLKGAANILATYMARTNEQAKAAIVKLEKARSRQAKVKKARDVFTK